MGMFRQAPPNLPAPPVEYSASYFSQMLGKLSTYFTSLNATQHLNVASLNLNLDTLPTDADVATLRAGDVYRDTTASNVLKVKV